MQDLILVPGLTCTRALWAAQIAGLASAARIAVADHTRHSTIADIAAALLAEAPPRFALAGLSMGGYIAFEVMRQAPERVTRLALLDTSAKPFNPAATAQRTAIIEKAHRDGMDAVLAELMPVFIHPTRLSDRALVDAVTQMGRDTGPVVFERQQRALMARADSRPTLAAIRCPTLVLTGAEDLLTPVAEHDEIAKGIAGARLEVVRDCGHLSTMERPDAVTAAMRDWLAR